MKKNFVILVLGAMMISCSSDDGDNIADNDISTGNYLPLSNGNYWKYDVESEVLTGSDSLYISGDMNANGETYKRFQTDEPAIGFYSNAVNNNGIRKEGDRLLMTGTVMMAFAEEVPLSINLNEFTILNESSANGTVLASVNGTIPYQYQDYTFDFNYTLTSTAMSHLDTYTAPDGTVYTDVKPVVVKLNLSVGTILTGAGVSLPVTIMNPQDVVVSTRYYAKDIGVVHSVTDIHYELTGSASLAGDLPLPSSVDSHQEEVLVDYQAD